VDGFALAGSASFVRATSGRVACHGYTLGQVPPDANHLAETDHRLVTAEVGAMP
jgi:hypothetical protein